MREYKTEIIDIHTHPYFIENVCCTNKKELETARSLSGLLKTSPINLMQMENKLNCAGIDRIVLHPLDLTTSYNMMLVSNEQMAEVVKLCPNRFIGFASVDPQREDSLEVLEYAFKYLGLRGLKLHPSKQRFFPDDPMLEPIYKICIKYNRPVMFHSGMSVQPGTLTKYAHPSRFEDVANNFSELRMCLAHLGWPWVQEVCMLLLKYHNVYTDTALVYFDSAKEMYDRVFTKDMGPHWLDRSLRHQVMFGSDDPGLEQIRMANALRGLDIRETTLALVMGQNAKKFLGEEV